MRATERKAAVRAGHSHPGAAGQRPPGPPASLPGENYSFPLLDKHGHTFYFPPFPLELTKGICGLRLWAPGGRRTGGDVTPEVRFPPQAQNGPPAVNPLRGEPLPATPHSAARSHPVQMPRRRFRGGLTPGWAELSRGGTLPLRTQSASPAGPPVPTPAGREPFPNTLQLDSKPCPFLLRSRGFTASR